MCQKEILSPSFYLAGASLNKVKSWQHETHLWEDEIPRGLQGSEVLKYEIQPSGQRCGEAIQCEAWRFLMARMACRAQPT